MADEHVDDPILDIRIAVAKALRTFRIKEVDHKCFTDTVVDELPDFYRQPLTKSHTPTR